MKLANSVHVLQQQQQQQQQPPIAAAAAHSISRAGNWRKVGGLRAAAAAAAAAVPLDSLAAHMSPVQSLGCSCYSSIAGSRAFLQLPHILPAVRAVPALVAAALPLLQVLCSEYTVA
jgi:hypothetical protein